MTITLCGRPSHVVLLSLHNTTFQSIPRTDYSMRFSLFRVRSPLLAESHLMSFPPGTEMFQFPGFASRPYGFGPGSPRREGFPHSDIRGSTIARISPRLFAACHVLHRLLAPRHPPNALFTLRIVTTTARTQDRTAPNEGHAPSHMRGRGGRTIQRALALSLSKLHNQFRIHL